MNRWVGRGVSGALVMAGVGALALVGTVRTASPPIPPAANDVSVAKPFVERNPFGTLELWTDPGGQLSILFYEDGTDRDDAEPVRFSPRRSDRCMVDLGSLGTYLELAIVNGPADIGLVDNGLGSRDQNNCNRSNGRIEPDQALAIELGSMFDDVVVDYARLDIEAKFGADMTVETSLAPDAPATETISLANKSDNDADSFGSDNNPVWVGTPPTGTDTMGTADDDFDRLVIAPSSLDGRGEISLEGGGDFAAAGTSDDNRTVFHLVTSKRFEYSLVCYVDGSTKDDPNDGTDESNPDHVAGTVEYIEESPGDDDWDIDVTALAATGYPVKTRLFRYAGIDADGNAKPCPAIGANLRADTDGQSDDSVLLEPSADDVNLRVELTWLVPAALVEVQGSDIFDRRIDVGGGTEYQAAPACDSFTGSSGAFVEDDAGFVEHPADTPWCVISDTRVLTTTPDGADVWIQTMVWDGLGDPRWA